VILFKHRILHSLGLGHRYSKRSVMRFYDADFQRNNAFFLMPEDYESLSRCYGGNADARVLVPYVIDGESISEHRRVKTAINSKNIRRYVRDYETDSLTLQYLDDFVNNFDKFLDRYINHR
jgi:hypothetical protein